MMRKTPYFYATFLHLGYKQNRPRFSTQTALESMKIVLHKSTNFPRIHKFGTHIVAPLHRAILLAT